NFNSLTFDYVARQKIGGTHMDFHYLKQLPVLAPREYELEDIIYVASRVAELVYTASDMESLSTDLRNLKSPISSFIPAMPFRWKEERRAFLRAELDAWFARAYGLTRKQLRYVLDPADLTPSELENILDPDEQVRDPLDATGYAARIAASDFPSETFRVLKNKDIVK